MLQTFTKRNPKTAVFYSTVFVCVSAVIGIVLAPTPSRAATGDITDVRIDNKGWYANIDITGLSTGGTYDFNLGTNNAADSNAKLRFTVTSSGFDDTGAATTITRTVYGTHYVRQLYPNQATASSTASGGTVTVSVALSDFIYSSDTATVDIDAGFYAEGGNSTNATSSVAVTNGSGEDYPQVVANWSWPGYRRITGATVPLYAVAYHRSAQQGRPVRAVKFTCTDEHSNSASDTVTSPSIDNSRNDAIPVIEYIGAVPTTSLTQGDQLTCNFQAYPWYGDANSVLNTGDGTNTMPTPLYAPQYYVLDKDGTYGVTVAVVDATGGDNATGQAVDNASFDSNNPPNAFANIYAAANAIASYNNTNHSRNDVGAGIIYLKEGDHAWTGGTVSAGTTPKTWVTVTKFPGATRANVQLTSGSGSKDITDRVKVQDIRINNTTSVTMMSGLDVLWLDQIDLYGDTTSYVQFYTTQVEYLTRSQIWNTDELETYSIVNSANALIRGNTGQETISQAGAKPYVMLGNDFRFNGGANIDANYDSQTVPTFSNMIYAYNRLEQTNGTNTFLGHLHKNSTSTTGIAIVQNVFEVIDTTSSPLLQVAADSSTDVPVNHVLIWHNTFVGQRQNLAYNDYNLNSVGPAWRQHWSMLGNIFEDFNAVTDVDAHGGTAGATRYGNHAIIHGTGRSGNVYMNRGVGDYIGTFIGTDSYYTGSALNSQYLDDESAEGGAAGNGNYNLLATSSAIDLDNSYVLLYDFDGNYRYGYNDAGAYEYQPPYTSGTDQLATSSTVRIYGDEKWRPVTATSTAGTADLSVTLPGTDRTEWLDVAISLWNANGTYQKTWTETSSSTGLTNTVHTIGDLAANTDYTVSVDGVDGANITGASCTSGVCTSNGSGQITFTYTGSYSSHTFDVSDNAAPTITNVSSDTADGSYKAGDVIDIDVTFSEPVTSTGNVTVTLETGTTDRTCTFTVSGSATGTCNYTVQAGDSSSDLTVSSIAGTITDGAGNAMSNFSPATNLAANKALVIDTSAPTLSAGSPSGAQSAGTTSVTLSLTTDESARCRYGTSADTAYASIANEFSATSTSHTTTVSGLTNGTSYNYYVRCQDAAGNKNSSDYTITFSVASAATNSSNTTTSSGGTPLHFLQRINEAQQHNTQTDNQLTEDETPDTSQEETSQTPDTAPITPPPPSMLMRLQTEADIVARADVVAIVRAVNQPRALAQEGRVANRYISPLVNGLSPLPATRHALINFITYGTPTTQRLGAGERAGVLNSFRAAFGRVPATTTDWQDALKIANGRWPNERDETTESNATAAFQTIYRRAPNRTNPHDDAAVMVIAYGLRPTDRNMASEQAAIRIFRAIYGYDPASPTAWDIVRAIAYSGARR